MRSVIDVRWLLALTAGGLMWVAAAHPAGTEAAEAGEPLPEASDDALGPDAEQRYAKGEAFYDGKWLPLETLFKDYCRQRDRLRNIQKDGSESQERLNKLHREMAQIQSEERKTEQPIRRELGMARQGLRKYNNILRQKPPAKPELQRLPPPPTRPSRNRSSSGSSDWNDSRDDWYDRARRQWQRRCDAIRRQNEMKIKQYRREMEEYQKNRNEAKQEVPKLEAKARECMKQLDEIEKQYEDKAAPTRRQSENAIDRVRTHNRRVDVLQHEHDAMAKALKAVPEAVRHKHGIVAFEGGFHSIDVLQERYKKTQAEIDHVRKKLQAECEEIGIPFPEDWRHPERDRMDKMKALVEKVKQAHDAGG